jgi:gas vesicle protein
MQDMTTRIDTAKGATMVAVKGARRGLLDTVKSVVEVVTLLRSLGADKVLGQLGLARRRTPLASLGVFATGLAVGAGLGMLFAPRSGRQTRSFMRDQLRKAGSDVKAKTVEAASQVEAKLEEVLESTEEAAEQKSKDAAPKGKKEGRPANAHKATV